MAVTLKCWSCGKKVVAENSEVNCSLSLAAAAADAGMVPIHDLWYGRVLVFCSDKCVKDQTTRAGNIRKYRKEIKND